MKKTTFSFLSRVLTSLVILSAAGRLCAQNIDMQSLIKETQKTEKRQSRLTMVWWIPEEFWAEALRSDPSISEVKIRDIVKIVNQFALFVVVDGEISGFGGVLPVAEQDITNKIVLKAPDGSSLKAIPRNAWNKDLAHLLTIMRPIFAQMLGRYGDGLYFMVFREQNARGKRQLDPTSEARFSVSYSKLTFRWRLPLGAFLPDKVDPETGEEFPGNYRFNPYTGGRLVEKK